MKPKYTAFIALMLIASLALGACGLNPLGTTYYVDETRTLALDGITMISVSDVSCPITIIAGEDVVSARLFGTCTGMNGPMTVEMASEGALLSIKVEYPQGVHNNDCTLTVTLPSDYASSLTIHNVSGDMDTSALGNQLSAVAIDTVSGNCTLSGAEVGRMNFNSVSGNLTVNGTVQNGLVFTSTSGNVEATGLRGSADVSSISGDATLTFGQAGDVNFSSTSGNINLYMPAGSAFTLDFDSVSGQFESDFPITLERSSSGALFGTSGNDGAHLSVETISGDAGIFSR